MALAFKTVVTPAVVAFYESDYYLWLIENANLLRTGRVSEADLDRIAEELEDMGRSERRALASHISVLVSHLLKWQFQSSHCSSSWRGSIQNARSSIQDLLEESPSLRNQLAPLVVSKYPNARFNAANETNLPESTFPDDCPYRLEDLLNFDFWPD
ncbi:hypothetical protein CCR95_16545 [Thiocystis minor]|uniref:DUF29 domain-containing protein n=1 Tax=Thiocystis minor TaxID=61597 RepID=UPI001912813E|nr:DUF29 domain-containing protein [Thiocystis minor]MBK5965650.1 hypothetical protein [Thiocystis minor]